MIRSNRGGELLGNDFTAFLDKHSIVHDQTCPYTPQHNGMAEREMRTLVEAVRTMLLHMNVPHHWWHLALRQAVWVRNSIEHASLPSGATLYTLMYKTKPNLTMAWVWGCMEQYMVLQLQRGGKLAPKASWGLHLGVSPASKGWEVLDLSANCIATTVEVIFYETQSLVDWKAERAPGSVHKVSTSTVSAPSPGLLADEIDDPIDTSASAPTPSHVPTSIPNSTLPSVYPRVVPVTKPSTSSAPAAISSPLPAAERISRPTPDTLSKSVDDDKGRHDALPSAPRIGIDDDRPAASFENGAPSMQKQAVEQVTGEQLTGEQISDGASSDFVEGIDEDNNDAGESSGDSSSSDVVEVKLPTRHSTRSNFGVPPKEWADVCLWDISTMTVKEALASWKGKAVKAAMEEEMRKILANGTWELVPSPRGVNVMKNRWIYGADYDEMYSPVGSYDTLRVFLSIVMVLDLHLMQLDMKNAYLQSKLDRHLYMEQTTYFNDSTSRVCKLLKSMYELKQSPLLWYSALDCVLIGGRWSKSQVDEALYFKFGDDGVGCWLLVYIDNFLAASSSLEMLKDLRELLQNAFELREITPVLKYLGLEIVRDSKLGSGLMIRNDQHWRELDRCIDYMVNTRDFTLEFSDGLDTLRLVWYADSSDEGDRQTRSSTSGYVFMLRRAAVSWASQRIKCMTLSSTEFEYIAATEAGKEARRLRFLLAKFWLLDVGVPSVMHVDNSSAISLTEGLGLKGSLKHMERRFIWLQQMVKRQKLVLTYIPTSEQPADYLTKALHSPAFKRCFVAAGQVDLADDEHENDQE
ncbi:unnamed protein product [Closterium sp. NIES-54]